MGLTIKTTTKPEDTAEFLASVLWKELKLGKKVLFFVTGGSSVPVAVKTAETLDRLCQSINKRDLLSHLTITLTDERYGRVGHADSNWRRLLDNGFSLPGAKLAPVLTGKNRALSVENFNKFLDQEFRAAEYKIGLFGVGKDGHTAGVLPSSIAVGCRDLVCDYDAPPFFRITMTPRAIERLDEAVVFVQGKEKRGVLESLLSENIDIMKQPAQVLKKVPRFTVFSDYKKE